MPSLRLNNSKVGAIVPPKAKAGKATQVFYRDDQLQGFGLRVTSQGSKSYFVEKRVHGKNKRITIGRHGQVTPVQARKEAQRLLGEMSLGKDPLLEKRKAAIKGTTLREAFQDYLKARKDLKPGTIHDYKVCIEKSLADWLDVPLTAIDKDMTERRHRQLGKASKARANNTMRVLRAVFNFAMDKYEDSAGTPLILINPVDRLSKGRGWFKVERRRTLLKPHELKPWYEATLLLNQETTRDYLHFLLFTGLRRSEASRLTWGDVDMTGEIFVIPDTKNREPHHLPLSDFLKALLERRKDEAVNEWVFPSPLTDGPLKEPRTAVAKVTEHCGITFQLHDLRRTFITIAESLDIPAYALKRLLNHKDSGDVTAGYIIPNTERLRAPMQRITDFIKQQARIE